MKNKNIYLNPPVNHQNDRWQEARQKAPGSGEGEICQARHGPCWYVLWRKRKTAFHSRQQQQ